MPSINLVVLQSSMLALLLCSTINAEESIKVPLEILKTGHIVVSVKVNDKGPYRLLFDTGAPVTIISSKVATDAKVIKPSLGFSLFGTGGQANIQSIELGNLKAQNNSVIVMDHPTIKVMSKFFGPIEGIIGFSTYSRYKLTINYKDSSIEFAPNGYIPQDTIKAMMDRLTASGKSRETLCSKGIWGFEVQKPESDTADGLNIISVAPNSVMAKAGLKKGDRILSLNNIWTDSLEDLFYASSKCIPNEQSKIQILSNNEIKTITVIPANGI
ncbi:MAG: PDZ domain-containing protein [Planctomycetes bacterium]|nr:PDZ domain-containing protein [Planctomycetota bacterium]